MKTSKPRIDRIQKRLNLTAEAFRDNPPPSSSRFREVCIYPPKVWSFNAPHSDGKTPAQIDYPLYAEALAKHKVGDVIRSYAGAPGTGHIDQRITRIDETGVYAVTISSTVRELEPWEVR